MKKWIEIKKNFSSIRWQITLRSWLVLIPCFAISNGIIYEAGKALMEKSLKERIAVTSEHFNFSIQHWQEESENLLTIISNLNFKKIDRSSNNRANFGITTTTTKVLTVRTELHGIQTIDH